MGSSRFTLVLAAWLVLLGAALGALVLAFDTPDLAAARIIAALLVAGAATGLWRHVVRTNALVARFVEALHFGDFSTRFDEHAGAGFGLLGGALNRAIRQLQTARDQAAQELRFLETLADDLPVPLLTVDDAHGVTLGNKAARRLFTLHPGPRPEDFAVYGATFAARLAEPRSAPPETILLQLPGGPQRAIVRIATLERLGIRTHAITVEPIETTFDAIEMAAQSDLVRVLTHEILNSLTPVVSLAQTADAVLAAEPPDIAAARLANATLLRRVAGLRRFIDSYRAVARPPRPRPQRLSAAALAEELARLFATEFPETRLAVSVAPEQAIEADPDLLTQALINLLRNAAQATGASGQVRLAITRERDKTLIEVADDGPGIPDHLKRDIFLPFFTTRAQGSGIGLNLVRQIAVAHGGSIAIEDASPHGARFQLRV